MKIYFDNTLINNDYVSKLTKTGKVYNGYFKIGATICETFKVTVDKTAFNEIPSIVLLKDSNNNLIKTLYVADYNDEDDFVITLELEDSMTKFNFSYDASQIFVDNKTTLGAIFADICSKANVDTDIDSFYGSTTIIGIYDNTYTARDYLSYIAEINGKNLRISADDKLEFVEINTTPVEEISFDDISKYKIGVEHTITRVVLEDWQFGNTDGETYYVNEANVYAMNEDTVEHIYDVINGFTYYNFKTNDCPLVGLNTGDLITFTDGTNEYNTFVQFDNANFSGSQWFGGIEVNLESPVKQETEIIGEQSRYLRIKRQVDYESGRIDQIIETTPIISTEGEGLGQISLTNLANNKLISLRIHPTDRDIIGLFASNLLTVKSGLKVLSRGITFDNTNGTENDIYYKIPDNLYYYDSETYDEFVYDGANERIYIVRMVEVDGQGNKSVLSEPVIEEYEYQDIVVEEGNYNVFMSTYPTAYIYIRAMIKNDYTDMFASSYEVDSKIEQTADSINLEVSKKVDEEEIISKINQSAEEIKIQADKISLEGTVTANNNFKIKTDGTMECNGATINEGKINLQGGTETTPKFSIVGSDNHRCYMLPYELNIMGGNAQFKTQVNLLNRGDTDLEMHNIHESTYTGKPAHFIVHLDGTDEKDFITFTRNEASYPSKAYTVNLEKNKIEQYLFKPSSEINQSLYEDGGVEYALIKVKTSSASTYIYSTGIITPTLTQTSKEEDKKDFEKLDNALNILKDIDIYKYHLKSQNNEDKKHIGFVIGDDFKYSKEITSNDNDGVDIYSFVSVCCKAIQEQQEQINSLKEEVAKLKESDK